VSGASGPIEPIERPLASEPVDTFSEKRQSSNSEFVVCGSFAGVPKYLTGVLWQKYVI
jgi:hypothetical protein